ncbi:MAG: hypothetical protein FWF95_02560 [Syntrophorhabdaceae bacterium]|nr:hypothetical protein [Syntrophorhabdaceae bacterium]
MDDPKDPKVLLMQIEAELAELKNQYDLFFQGGRRGEPTRERKDLESKLLTISRRAMIKSADQNRFSNLQAKFWSNVNLWARIIRDFEEGRLRRDKRGALTRAGIGQPDEAGPAMPKPSAPSQGTAPAPAAGTGNLDQAAKALMEARKKCGIQANPSELASLRSALESRAKELSASAGGKKVEFHVTVEGGKPKVKTRLS